MIFQYFIYCIRTSPDLDWDESGPDPQINHALDRGMHLLAMDGPGQGMSNLRGTKLTADNYERAVIAVAKWE